MTASSSLASLQGVHKRYGEKVALAGLDLEVRQGELLALLGPNGACKTTAISILLGLRRPDEGSVRLLGGSPRDIANRRGVGVMLQQEVLTMDMSLRELLDVVTSYYPAPYSIEEVIEITDTAEIAGIPYMRLSGGLQRRVQYALAICGRPKLVFLDEPTSGLDVEAREMQWKTIRALLQRRTAIVLTTHYLEEAEELADRVVMLAEGKCVAHGTVSEMCSLVPRKTISCYTSIALDRVRSWPEVREATVDEKGRLNLVVSEAEVVARQLLAADNSLRELEVRRASLSDAFKTLTKGVKQ
jgi:ABC-2 type transport system ATP-binding protein